MYFSHSSVIQIWQEGGVFSGVFCFSKTNPHLWNETKQRSFSTDDSLRREKTKKVEACKIKLGERPNITTTMDSAVRNL